MLFPGGRLPLRIFEQRYMDMAKRCLKDNAPFGVCLIVEGREVGEPAVPAALGTLATIAAWDMPQLGVLNVVAAGGRRFRIVERRVQEDGLARASIALLDEERDLPVPEALFLPRKILARILDEQPGLLPEPHALDSCAWVGGRLAELLPLPMAMKQELLELDDVRERLSRLAAVLKPA